ncbi:MAG TPA: type III polyketide synthase [Stellaceae bacterium]
MTTAFVNRIATAVPGFDVHRKFVDYAPRLLGDGRMRRLFARMAERAEIEHRYSFFEPDSDPERLDAGGFYRRGVFPDTAARMRFFETHAFDLARDAIDRLDPLGSGDGGGGGRGAVTHVIVTCCTGFAAPGLDLQIVGHLGLDGSVERTIVGFMGCYAAMNGLKLARHIVRSEPETARVLMLNLELCTLHLQEIDDLETVLSFLIFADGCAASLITAEPTGIALDGFASSVLADSADQITWRIGRGGFDMHLSGQVPATIGRELPRQIGAVLGNRAVSDIDLWAIHPGGRTVLDAVERALDVEPQALRTSRGVLRDYGNMSSATIMFVLKRMLEDPSAAGEGCAMAFGPGLTVEAMRFRKEAA